MGLFLASDEASYVNGQAFPVDGGLTASMPYAGKPIYLRTLSISVVPAKTHTPRAVNAEECFREQS